MKVKRNGKTQLDGLSDNLKAETIDAKTGTLDPTPGKFGKGGRRIDLSSLRDVRLELAAVYRQMDAEEIESQEGTRRAYVLKTIADVITLAELEKRIQELEERQGTTLPGQRQLQARALN